MKKIITLSIALFIVLSTFPQDYSSSYMLNGNFKTELHTWIGSETEIDFTKDKTLNQITKICDNAFYTKMALVKITLPATLLKIDDTAFGQCYNIEEINCYAPTPPEMGTDVFEDVDTDEITLKVPTESVDAYKAADQWKDFKIDTIAGGNDTPGNDTPGNDTPGNDTPGNDTPGDEPSQDYPSSSYTLNGNSKTELFTWNGAETEIDFTKDKTLNQITKICDNAFHTKMTLVKITLPATLLEIEENAFGQCVGLKEVSCYALAPPKMGTDVFESVDTDKITLKVPAESVDAYKAADQWKNFKIEAIADGNDTPDDEFSQDYPSSSYKLSDDGKTLQAWIGPETEIDMTRDSKLKEVTTIGKEVFEENQTLTKIIFPEGLLIIDDYAFNNTSNLKEAKLPSTLQRVGKSAFFFCTKLEGDWNLPNSLTDIAPNAFYGVKSLSGELNLPVGLTIINDKAFGGCDGISGTLNIPEGIKSVGWNSFENCFEITKINLPESLTKIDDRAFINCYGVTADLIIPDNVTSIGERAFYNCKMTKMTFPAELQTLGEGAFLDCDELNTNLTLPNKLTTIGAKAFLRCSKITGISLPAALEIIGAESFMGCGAVNQISCSAEEPPTVGLKAFDGIPIDINLYVPEGSVNKYKEAEQWKEFKVLAINSTAINTFLFQDETKIWTNKGILSVKCNRENLTIEIYDLSGKKLYNSVLKEELKISLTPGIYIVRIDKQTKKIIVR